MLKYLVVLFLALPSLAWAQCYPSDALNLEISNRYGEKTIVQGVAANGHLVRVLTNLSTGTWTIVGDDPNKKLTCVIATGEGLEIVAPKEAGQGS